MKNPAPRNERPLDVVLWGATGFTGRLVAEYLARHGGALRWAMGGRSRSKLEAVRAEIAREVPGAAQVPIRVADARDPASLDAMVAETRVVCTTVGPYAKYGHELVASCAGHGTDYCDLTGEVPFVRITIDRHDARAKETGARIVHCCGFDSIPSDLGTLMLVTHAKRTRDKPLAEVRLFAGESRGGVSGGTIASMLNLMDEAAKDKDLRRLLADPYALSPDRAHDLDLDGRDPLGISRDRTLGVWTGPFVMAAVNTRIVRRSNALLGHAYGRHFRYSEVASFRAGARGLASAALMTAGVAGFVAAATLPAARPLLRRVLPAPGEGPSKQVRDTGFFKIRLLATVEGDSAPTLLGRVEGTSDPGYGETAKMLSEAAMCLAGDTLEPRAGVLTPATAMGMRLVDRLRAAGMTFSVSPLASV